MDQDVLDRVTEALPTVLVGAFTLSFSLSVAKCVEFLFRTSFGDLDSVLKHVAFAFVCMTLLFVVVGLSVKQS
jgi:hypothetical protein